MNYLELCQRVARRAGVSGSHTAKPDTVVNQTGRMALVCDYVAEASREIESAWNDFTFMRVEIDFAYPKDEQKILPATDHGDIERINIQTVTARDENERQVLTHIPWKHHRTARVLNIDTTDMLPEFFSIDHSGNIHAFPICDHDWILRAECTLKPKILAADTDESHIPAEYRDTIVHRARMMYHEEEEAWQLYQSAEVRYMEWMERLESRYLPGNSHGRTQTTEIDMVVVCE